MLRRDLLRFVRMDADAGVRSSRIDRRMVARNLIFRGRAGADGEQSRDARSAGAFEHGFAIVRELGKSMCAWESMSSMIAEGDRCVLEARANFHIFQEARQNRAAFRSDSCGDDHAVGFDTAQFARSEIRNHRHFAADQFFRLVKLGDAGADLAHFRADIDGEFQQFVGARDAFGGLNLPDAHFDLGEVLNADFFRGCGRRGGSSSGSWVHLRALAAGCRCSGRLL